MANDVTRILTEAEMSAMDLDIVKETIELSGPFPVFDGTDAEAALSVHTRGFVLSQDEHTGQVLATPFGAEDPKRALRGGSVPELAVIIEIRDMMNMPELAEPRPVWAALKHLTDSIDALWYGGQDSLKAFEVRYLHAKYALKGIDAESDPWNYSMFEPTEERMAAYAEPLLREMAEGSVCGDILEDQAPRTVLIARNILAGVLSDSASPSLHA